MYSLGLYILHCSSRLYVPIILFSGYAPVLMEYLNKLNQSNNDNDPENGFYDPNLAYYLYENNVENSEYNFNAEGECFILAEIEGIDFTWFVLDDQNYSVSYGLNIIPVEFANPDESHQILIDLPNLEYFRSLTVEPLILAENTLVTSLNKNTTINFQAGGPISILVPQPSWLTPPAVSPAVPSHHRRPSLRHP